MKICSSDGSAISKWRHPDARGDGGGEDGIRLDAGVELDLRPLDARPEDARAGHAAQPRQPVVAVDGELHDGAGRPSA